MINYGKLETYNYKFCSLIGANPDIKYSKKNIFHLLLLNGKETNNNFEFSNELKDFLKEIQLPGWCGYKKKDLKLMLNTLIVSSINSYESKYIVVSLNKSDIPVKNISIFI